MRYLWLIQSFNAVTFTTFIPDPALYRTEKEASNWCDEHSSDRIQYGYSRVRVGSFVRTEKEPT